MTSAYQTPPMVQGGRPPLLPSQVRIGSAGQHCRSMRDRHDPDQDRPRYRKNCLSGSRCRRQRHSCHSQAATATRHATVLCFSAILPDWIEAQTGAKAPGFSPTASKFTAETDSPLEGSGFELVVPRHESPRFPDQRKQAETADTKPKRACLAAVTSARRRGYSAAVELDPKDQGS